jgi:uncharacterized protein YdcH (DUF465 family)
MKVEWQTLRLAAATGSGYADSAGPVDDILRDAVAKAAGGVKPVVVFICDDEDSKTNDSLEANVFSDEKVALAMKRFVCLKATIQSIPDEKVAEKLRRQTPIFRYFDPAGKALEELSGKRAASRSAFSARVEALWKLSFEKVLKEYVSEMSDLLDRMDRLATEKQRIEDQITRAEGNPQKVAALQKEAESLKTDENTIKQDEEKLLGSVTVRPEFLPAAAGDEKACK